MTTLTAEMAYEIGQIVYMRDALHNAGSQPTPHIITERFVQECHGGIQRLYKFSGDTSVHSEVALTDKELEYVPTSDARIDDEIRIAGRRHAADRARWDAEKTEAEARKDKTDG